MKHTKHKSSIFTLTNVIIAVLAIALILSIFTKGFTNIPFGQSTQITGNTFIILNDERCTGTECDATQIISTLQEMFPELSYQTIDYNTKQGMELYQDLELDVLPAILFTESVKNTSNYAEVSSYLEQRGDYLNLLIGATYDPNPETCDNGEDDNDDGFVDCEDPDCKDSIECAKSDKPEVELFIWSYCPYGVMAQEPMAEVAQLLGDNADFTAVLYYAGHGEYELQQNKIQACIQKLDPDNYWAYAESFVNEIYPECGQSGDINCDLTSSVTLMNELGIDSNAIISCVESYGESLVQEDYEYARENSVTGSPTIIINGVTMQLSRTPAAILEAVCSAFNEAPEVCNSELSSDATSSGGSC